MTATSHTRGSVGRSPAQFKEVIGALLGDATARDAWAQRVAETAARYRAQVLLDYDCFRGWVLSGRWREKLLGGAKRADAAA